MYKKYIDPLEFQHYILETYLLKPENIDKLMESVQTENKKSFREGMIFGLSWASLSTIEVPYYIGVEKNDS